MLYVQVKAKIINAHLVNSTGKGISTTSNTDYCTSFVVQKRNEKIYLENGAK